MADVDDPDNDDEELVESMGKLQEIQGELAKINEEERSKVKEVKRKHNEFRKALYNRRNEIIQSISGFWVTAFLGHPALADRVSEEDKKVFKYMVSLEVEDFKDEESGYSITFNFSPNPFFEDTKLTKTFSLSKDEPTDVISTAIKWKDGMNIASGSAQENKGTKRAITQDSFFSWFGEEKTTLPIDVIDEMATTIREELWIDPLNYFSNNADEDVDEGGSNDDDNNDYNDEENNDEDLSGNVRNDDDNDDDDEEYDDEDFNVSNSADDDNNNDEIEVIDDNIENIEEDEIQQQYDVELDDADQDDDEETEEQDDDDANQDDDEEIKEQDDEEIEEQDDDDDADQDDDEEIEEQDDDEEEQNDDEEFKEQDDKEEQNDDEEIKEQDDDKEEQDDDEEIKEQDDEEEQDDDEEIKEQDDGEEQAADEEEDDD